MVSFTIAIQGFVSVDEILKLILAVLSCGTVYYAIKGGSNLNLSLRKKSSSVTIQIKATE